MAIPRTRPGAYPAILSYGFRPFFLLGSLFGGGAILFWLPLYYGKLETFSVFSPVDWHVHELLFGYLAAVVTGFLLTAIPNWTGRLPIAGRPLLSLFGIWVAARFAVLFSSRIGLWPAAILDVGLYVALALLAAREVIASKNRNVPIVGLVLLFGLADAADYLGQAGTLDADLGWRSAMALVIIMISVVGGRIIPSFTRNWMVKRGVKSGLPTQPQSLDLLVIASTALALLFWLAFPAQELAGGMLLLAAAAQALRLSRWGGHRTFADPLVAILHAGYAWVPIGLALLGLSVAGYDLPQSAGVHSMTAGAMTTMILAVMSRASLGHTGRDLSASPMTVAAYACVTIGALLRVSASLGIGPYGLMVVIAGAFWGAALLLFLIVYRPVLWGPRLGEAR